MQNVKGFLLNGTKYYTEQNLNIFDLINYFGYDDSLLIIEYNGLICNKKEWKITFIDNQDKIEIVSIVGGG